FTFKVTEVCFFIAFVIQTTSSKPVTVWFQAQIDPRGARPVEHGTRSEKCATEKEWPFCTDDEWGPKCPSGCRIQGLMDKFDHGTVKKIEQIRSLLEKNKASHRSTDVTSRQTYDYLKEKLTLEFGNNNNYYDLAQNLRQRITDMKIKIDRQIRILAALKDRVKDQVTEMQRLEVDIDIKLRSCKGSCASYSEHQVDQDSYVTLDKQINQLDSQFPQNIESVGTLYVMKSKPLQDVIVDSVYKSKDIGIGTAAQKKDDLFQEVRVQYAPRMLSSSSVFYVSVTSHVSTQSVSCTKSIRKTVVHTKDGPVEKTEEVIEGGPECQALSDSTKGGMSSLFPSLTHTSSSSSSHSVHTGGAKGSLLGDTKTGFVNPFGSDLGGFTMGAVDDDVPDFHARSVNSMRVERQADYVGKDCVDAHRNHLNGETNGLFKIKPGGGDSAVTVEVYCQQEGFMGGWLLVQQREGGALDFNRTWAEYRDGFGSVDAKGKGELWLGNQNLHLLTAGGETMLKVELEDREGGVASAEYTVRIGPEDQGFPLHVSGYTGDAGDALVPAHNGMKFSAFDRDASEGSCAERFGGGWWYNSCQTANLNGIYSKGPNDPSGVVWATYKPAGLKSVRMFIRSAAF
uniref:Fibrinogen C-terminal domain-containing protein n=1 Tax=Amphiprion ocellaris TaxID=80972 RepID=A0A3Q1C560_AMPOC